MSITYWLNFENMERCFLIYRKGTVFEKEPAYITAYEACKGLNEYYASEDNVCIPLRDAQTGTRFSECATRGVFGSIDKMITWLREKHDIFYFPAMNLCIPLEDPLSRSVKKFWEEEDAQQKQIEEYCKSDPACGLSLKKMHNRYMRSYEPPTSGTDFKTRFDLFVEKVWEGAFDEEAPVATSVENKTARAEALYEKLVGLKKEHDKFKERNEKLACDYEALWIDREKKKRMLNSFYGATCGVTADAYGEVQRLKKERDELKEERDNLVKRLEEIDEYGYGGYACSGCKRTTCGYFTEILSSLGIKEVIVCPPRGRSRVESLAKLANERARVIFTEHQNYLDDINELHAKLARQERIIGAQRNTICNQDKQLKDLGVALGNVKNTVDFEIDTLMADHGDNIIPVF